jgi:hypothetical protein|tara:strand:- start:55 stop:1422 length:1368 start_codon:yes stop_codon:yes gene_type:complete
MLRLKQYLDLQEAIDATKFEGNLLKAMGASDSSVGSYNKDATGEALAADIVSKMKKENINISNPKRSSGSAAKGTLSDIYKDFGVKSTEAKADISFGGNGVSVKAKAGAQLLSAQGPEAAAIIQYLVTNDTNAKKLAGDLAKQIPNAIKSAFDPKNYYAGRAGESGIAQKGTTYPTELAFRADNIKNKIGLPKGDLTQDQKDKITTAKKELTANDKKLTVLIKDSDATDYVEGAKKFGISEDISRRMKKMFNNSVFREAVILEAMSGNGKFTNKEAQATHVLGWGTDGSYSYQTVEQAAKNVSGYNFRVSDRGSKSSSSIKKMGDMSQLPGELTGRGGSFRIDILPSNLQESLDTDTKNYIDEMANKIGENHRAYLTENLEYTQELLLQEGLWDKISGGIKNVKDKIMSGINLLVDKIKSFVSKIGKWMMKMVKNTGYYLMAFNMKPKLNFKLKV